MEYPDRKILADLARSLQGELHYSALYRRIYATDASVYRQLPLAVVYPKSVEDLRRLIFFASQHKVSLIARAAGTSLAGQVVGDGVIVDFSRHFNSILEINSAQQYAWVEPGVVRDELNLSLKAHNLFFAPETSTSNRAMIGGMVGNNACGGNALVFGSTREHVLSIKALLSDGSEVLFDSVAEAELKDRAARGAAAGAALEYRIYEGIYRMLADPENQTSILGEFPKASIKRRNTGYALDLLLQSRPFNPDGEEFNLCKLLCGSEGTLAMVRAVKVRLTPFASERRGLVCAHFMSVEESLKANLIALKRNPCSCELIDRHVIECSQSNLEQRKNRFFIKGNPEAILIIELKADSESQLRQSATALEREMRLAGLGYHFYHAFDASEMCSVVSLRKAGLGVLANTAGDAKPVAVVEDTAVAAEDLPDYIKEFDSILSRRGLSAVHYGHVGTGELHLRPLINLKTAEGVGLFRQIGEDVAHLVKKYRGSLSGEHGDGRVRGEFLPIVVGQRNYTLFKKVKRIFDPSEVFNPGKIVDAPRMDCSLRYDPLVKAPSLQTYFHFRDTEGILRAAELCNGSGDCRKTQLIGGVMCPSYMASRDEKDTTRARANIIRDFLTYSGESDPFDHVELLEVLDLCLSCKGCKAECPSNVDVARLKAEFLQHYYDRHGASLRALAVGNYRWIMQLASLAPHLYNFAVSNPFLSRVPKWLVGMAPQRNIPPVSVETFRKWFRRRSRKAASCSNGAVFLFVDEFSNYQDAAVAIKATELLERLGYAVLLTGAVESGRTQISKGLIRQAQKVARRNVRALSGVVTAEAPLVGIEPSALLTIRDEYLDLVNDDDLPAAKEIARNSFLFEEFLFREMGCGKINPESFKKTPCKIVVHGHCHQKALSSVDFTVSMLSLCSAEKVEVIPCGCCGMAGNFGYEKEHYQFSQQIGNLTLFPAIRDLSADTLIGAPGTSCRTHIWEGTGRKAQHPIEILWSSLPAGRR